MVMKKLIFIIFVLVLGSAVCRPHIGKIAPGPVLVDRQQEKFEGDRLAYCQRFSLPDGSLVELYSWVPLAGEKWL